MSDTPSIHVALASVMSAVTHVGKTGKNTQQGYNFRGIDGVLNAVGPALRTHCVLVLPQLLDMTSQSIEVGQKRTLMREVTVRVRYRFVGPAGDHLDVEVPGEAMDSGDKAVSKAMSVAMRTALIQALALPTDEPDPDESDYERVAARRPAKPAESSALTGARQAAKALGDSARTVVPSIIAEVTGTDAKLADLTDDQLAEVTSEILRAAADSEEVVGGE